jgi:hypothetical protein
VIGASGDALTLLLLSRVETSSGRMGAVGSEKKNVAGCTLRVTGFDIVRLASWQAFTFWILDCGLRIIGF